MQYGHNKVAKITRRLSTAIEVIPGFAVLGCKLTVNWEGFRTPDGRIPSSVLQHALVVVRIFRRRSLGQDRFLAFEILENKRALVTSCGPLGKSNRQIF